MSETRQEPASPKPVAVRDEDSAGFFDGAGQGILMLQHCSRCGAYSFTEGHHCPQCLTPVEWVKASGRGRIYSWTLNYQRLHPAYDADLPNLFGWVELEEGPMIITKLVDLEQDDLRPGMPVSVCFMADPGGESVPVFGPVLAGGGE